MNTDFKLKKESVGMVLQNLEIDIFEAVRSFTDQKTQSALCNYLIETIYSGNWAKAIDQVDGYFKEKLLEYFAN